MKDCPHGDRNDAPTGAPSFPPLGKDEALRLIESKGAEHSLDSFVAHADDPELLHAFLAAGMDINAEAVINRGGKVFEGDATPLTCASMKGSEASVRYLLGRGANPDVKSSPGDPRGQFKKGYPTADGRRTALSEALMGGHATIAALLAENGAETAPVKTAEMLHYCARRGAADALGFLVERGMDVDMRDSDGNTPLITAVRHGHSGLARVLIESGADINAVNRAGNSALKNAVSLYDAEDGGVEGMVRMLVERGADTKGVFTAGGLHAAARGGLGDAVEAYLDNGVEVDAKDARGNTALMAAASEGREYIVRLLLERGADANARNNEGRTALMAAAMYEERDRPVSKTLKCLVEAGADLDAKDMHGKNALRIAQERQNRYLNDVEHTLETAMDAGRQGGILDGLKKLFKGNTR